MTRDKKLIAIFAMLSVLTAGSVLGQLAVAEGPTVAKIDQNVAIGLDGRLSVQFLGDTMLGDAAQSLLNIRGYGWPLAGVARALDGDHVVANLEAPLTTINKPYNPAKQYSYSMNPAGAGALARAGVDSFGVANNHAMDAGPVGLAQTRSNAAAVGASAFGAGENLARAEQPLLLHSEMGTIGIIGLAENIGKASTATKDQVGSVALSPQTIQRGVDLARAGGADWVVAYVHWGDNYTEINERQRFWARMFVDAGYDMVVGAGPHIVQPIEFIGSVPIAYSLGNFVFTTPGRFHSIGRLGYGLSLSVELSRTQQTRLSVRCLVTDNRVVSYQPKLCNAGQSAALLRATNPDVSLEGDRGLLPCTCFVRRD